MSSNKSETDTIKDDITDKDKDDDNDKDQVVKNYKVEVFSKFEDMGLKDSLLRGVFAYGFENPSAVQSRAIVPLAKGMDLIAQSQSGTGKTGAFTIGILQQLDDTKNGCQAIIVCHTRELSFQIIDVCKNIGQYLKNVVPVLCTGGTNINESRNQLRQGTNIAIGTPGRINDMITRGFIKTGSIKVLVIDEADEMLSPGFQHQIKDIIEAIPETSQICLFSATLPSSVIDLSEKFLNNPVKILVKTEELTLEGIRQFYINVEKEEYKLETFSDLYDHISVSQSMVYVNTKRKADNLKYDLEQKNFAISVIHSDMSPEERTEVMSRFRSGQSRILISTDLLSRGIDIQQVSLVINYDLPTDKECYLHRIGRSGRFGRKGVAINFVTNRDEGNIQLLEQCYQTQIEELPQDLADIMGN